MIYIFAAALLIAAALLRSSWERRQLRAESYTVGCHEAHEKVRLVFLCDIHDRLTEEGIRDITALVHSAGSDAVLLGGDIFTCMKGSAAGPDTSCAVRLCESLSREAAVFYAEGNHEYRYRKYFPEGFESFQGRLEEAGVLYLRDEHIIYRGLCIHAVSLDEPYYKKVFPFIGSVPRLPHDYLIKKLGLPDRNHPNILLMHSPMFLREASAWGADLVLSGHFHGGTIRLPFLGGLMTPQYSFFVKECSGMHSLGKTVMIVSRGIGTHSVRLRLNDLPEVSVIDIVPEEPAGA